MAHGTPDQALTANAARRGRPRWPLVTALVLLFSLLLAPLAARPARAQVATASGPNVTVFASGTATRPADLATVQLLIGLGDRQFGFSETRTNEGGLKKISSGGSATFDESTDGGRRGRRGERETITPEQVEALVAAVAEAADIEPEAIASTLSPLAARRGEDRARTLRLDLVVEQPTPDSLSALLETTSDAAAAEGLVVEVAGVRYDPADCAVIEEAAEQAAIADAEVRAERLARLLGVRLGGVVAASGEPNYALEGEEGCSGQTGSSYDSGHGGLGITVPVFDPARPADVTVTARLTISYEILGDG